MGHPAVPRSVLQMPSPWKKPCPARPVSQGRECPLPRRLPGEGWAQGGRDPLTSTATTVPSWKSWEPAKPQTPMKGLHGREDHKFTSLGLFPAACLKAKPQAQGVCRE